MAQQLQLQRHPRSCFTYAHTPNATACPNPTLCEPLHANAAMFTDMGVAQSRCPCGRPKHAEHSLSNPTTLNMGGELRCSVIFAAATMPRLGLSWLLVQWQLEPAV